MKIQCPYCGQHYEVENTDVGLEAQCTNCSQNFVIQDNLIPQAESVEQELMIQGQVISSSNSSLRALTCEMCGSTDLIKQEGVFVCQSCGTKYSVEEAKKMMISGTVNVAGTVRVDNSNKLENYYTIARRAHEDGNAEIAAKYYELILVLREFLWVTITPHCLSRTLL